MNVAATNATTSAKGCNMPEHVNLNTHWFYTVWPFIGVGAAIVMIAVLLWTDAFRANLAVSRWRDLVWLCWLAVPLYLLHQFGPLAAHIVDQTAHRVAAHLRCGKGTQ